MKVAVIGATGALGRHVIPRLVERGHQVRAIVRKPAQVEWFQRMGVEAVQGDILEADTLLPATVACEAALHIATAIPKPGGAADWSLNDRIRREGTRNFLAACQVNTVRRYVQQSITLLYSEQGKTIVDESTPIQPDSITLSAADMEEIVEQANLDWCILRGGLFYGPGTGRQDEWRQAVQAGKLQYPGDGSSLISLLNVVDMARAIIVSVERADARTVYNIVDDQPVDYRSLYGYLAAQAGIPKPQPGGEVVLPSLGCSNERIKAELGWEPMYPTYRSGLA